MSVVIFLFVRLILSAVRPSQAATFTVRLQTNRSSVIGSVTFVCRVCEQV
jgi:hypothetical protein